MGQVIVEDKRFGRGDGVERRKAQEGGRRGGAQTAVVVAVRRRHANPTAVARRSRLSSPAAGR